VDAMPKVGGTKKVDTEAVKALKPDLVIANVEENEKPDIEALAEAGLSVFVTYPRTVAAAAALMRTLAEMTGTEKAAAPQVAAVEAAAALMRARLRDRTPLRVFCPVWRKPWMTINADTYMHDLMDVCGLRNVYADGKERYPRTTLEEAAKRSPEVVLLPDEPFRFVKRHAAEVAAAIPAIPRERILLVDGKDMCWYGPRTAGAIKRLAELVWV
jgi:ABC-type Fe3+-hydroxamate transport system substrate-binding protein